MLSLSVNSVTKQTTGVFSVFATVGGRPMYVTLDTGADQVSCIDENSLKYGEGTPYTLQPLSVSQGLITAGSEPLPCSGVVILPVRLRANQGPTREVDVVFHVVR